MNQRKRPYSTLNLYRIVWRRKCGVFDEWQKLQIILNPKQTWNKIHKLFMPNLGEKYYISVFQSVYPW